MNSNMNRSILTPRYGGIWRLSALRHGVQCTSILEPLDLGLVESVGELDIVRGTILGVNTESDGLADSELSAEQVNGVIGFDLIIVGWVGECKGQHALLLQVGFVLR